ncbi:hypothetical protein LCGC14_0926480 [marine sediment metagenome]|uniref:Uncharacterized protein n=1 Tax=marine sediment metagenome TaxID=412755 RepID=A0A0F9RVY1_9ZZZZ|nr:MAG: hypothetical protein Lokiarch_09090 [Candidatus Lokiarchaeum sp. GC14_75]
MEEQKKYYKPSYSVLFNKIKDIRAPIKNEIIKSLLDGQWHSELELIRITKRKRQYMGAVTLGIMVNNLNLLLNNNYVQTKIINNKLHYKLSDNYVGLTRAAYRFETRRLI